MRAVRTSLWIAVGLSLTLSLAALYVKLYFWGGTRYSPLQVKVLFWFVILAGPLALMLRRKWPGPALVVVGIQAATLIAASL